MTVLVGSMAVGDHNRYLKLLNYFGSRRKILRRASKRLEMEE
jgi:hypothetical protein